MGEDYLAIKEIKRLTIVQQVVEGLREYIMSGELQVGDKLPTERELCQQFGVGRGTVREAVCTLQALGFVEMIPGKGSYVASKEESSDKEITRWFAENEVEVMDVIQVRSVIEPLAIKLAMKHATDQDREALREIHQQTLKAVDSGDFIKLGQYDESFHAHIIECSQNKMLISINKQISDFLKNFRGKTFRIPNNVQNIVPAHTSILNAFLEGDTEKAGKCMAAHMEQIMVDLESSKDYEMKQ